MKKLTIFIFLLTILFIILSEVRIVSQENYWIGMNFELKFNRSGIVEVSLRMHPFDINGKSLLYDKNVTKEIIDQESTNINILLLLFTNNPRSITYNIINHTYLDNNSYVICDVNGTGRYVRLNGALVLKVEVQLNSTNVVRKVGNNTYAITIKDSLTYMDPRSWIDVINFSFLDDVKLINYSFSPRNANGPTKVGKNYLLWINPNEVSAPDYYYLTLVIPEFKERITIEKLSGKILDAKIVKESNEVVVKVQNTGNCSGFFEVEVSDEVNQTRKVYLNPGEVTTLYFPFNGNETRASVKLFTGERILDSREFGQGSYIVLSEILKNSIGYIIILIGFLIILLSMRTKSTTNLY